MKTVGIEKIRVVLGIETSCDETAAALLVDGKIVADRTTTQLLHEEYGGVVPELASRAHEQLLMPAVEGVLKDSGLKAVDIEGVTATCGPGLAGALLVGVSFGKGLAAGLNIPFLGVNHLEAHLWGAELTYDPLPMPFLGLIISGGHTLMVGVKGLGQYTRLGGTHDDAVGELFDKVGRMLGYGFPAGEAIDRDALGLDEDEIETAESGVRYPNHSAVKRPRLTAVKFPRARVRDDAMGFSFSGLKTAVLYYLRERYCCQTEASDSTLKTHPSSFILHTFSIPGEERASVSRGLLESVSDMLITGLSAAWNSDNYRGLVISGGVASSRFLRVRFTEFADKRGIPLFIPPPEHCTDNGAMIAYLGYRWFRKGYVSSLDLPVDPAADLFSSSHFPGQDKSVSSPLRFPGGDKRGG